MRKIDDFEVAKFMTAPARPEPKRVCIREALEWREVEYMRGDFDRYTKALKLRMARKLADYIVHECGVLQVPGWDALMRNPVVEMEFILNDASAYSQWLPAERKRGVKEGREALSKELPYGMEVGQFYE